MNISIFPVACFSPDKVCDIQKSERYDVKGRKYIKTPVKYYFSDSGIRNAVLGFRRLEETHLMENILYNDLVRRGFDVDVGVVEYNTKDNGDKKVRKQLEVDFVVNRGDDRYYIHSWIGWNLVALFDVKSVIIQSKFVAIFVFMGYTILAL